MENLCITFKLLQNLGAENNKHLSSYSFLCVRQVGVAYLGELALSLLQGCNQGSTRAGVTPRLGRSTFKLSHVGTYDMAASFPQGK